MVSALIYFILMWGSLSAFIVANKSSKWCEIVYLAMNFSMDDPHVTAGISENIYIEFVLCYQILSVIMF